MKKTGAGGYRGSVIKKILTHLGLPTEIPPPRPPPGDVFGS